MRQAKLLVLSFSISLVLCVIVKLFRCIIILLCIASAVYSIIQITWLRWLMVEPLADSLGWLNNAGPTSDQCQHAMLLWCRSYQGIQHWPNIGQSLKYFILTQLRAAVNYHFYSGTEIIWEYIISQKLGQRCKLGIKKD